MHGDATLQIEFDFGNWRPVPAGIEFVPHPPSPIFRNLTGERFGRLRVLGYAGRRGSNAQWWALCSCGDIRRYALGNLQSGATASCGCLNREMTTTHGFSQSSEYRIWVGMKARCFDPRSIAYHSYGARGSTVCTRWVESVEVFIADMGPRPSDKHSIERIDNDGNYEPSNCVWATDAEQSRNKRSTQRITFNGQTMCLTDWAKKIGMPYYALRHRIRVGWPVGEALTAPMHKGVRPQGIEH